ncbi:ABC transporter ATP-binding protein [Candidatus Nitrospira neomarina]|uniref:ABC transporter ATP-binding protein n=1 Tax=Candidatus Nitrospira neomarina TaxID=3020899 RepID=A0AA96GM51_9BACT|nr:ABC transporter ATP-binding protein [Candidatus Nitrospira neomarina]WNM63713.1 ABC transporter ATP-binding protein [Candidatus Nitrospira neomarina]
MNESVVLDKVIKTHGLVRAVDHVSLSIQSGEFFSILGPSGSGKTTILRLIAGLDRPDQGDIVIQQRVVTLDPPHKRPVNMVFQHYALFPHLSVFENVAFGLHMKGEGQANIHTAVSHMLALVRLQGKEKRLPGQLSGGEQQRVALARALVNRPVVLLLDEPLAALDQQLRQEMQGELKRLQREVKATFICVTHQQDEALMLSDRIAVMQGGKVLQVGTPQEIYDRPVSSMVAQFIGLSNVLSGTIASCEGGWCRVDHDVLAPVKVTCSPHKSLQGAVTVMIRPERLHVSSDMSPNGYENRLPAIVHQVAFSGNEVVYHVRLRDEAIWMARVPIAEAQARPLAVGQPVYVQWRAQEGLVLPAHPAPC